MINQYFMKYFTKLIKQKLLKKTMYFVRYKLNKLIKIKIYPDYLDSFFICKIINLCFLLIYYLNFFLLTLIIKLILLLYSSKS